MRSHWGWGYEDQQPSPAERRAAAAGLAEHLGFGSPEPEEHRAPPGATRSCARPTCCATRWWRWASSLRRSERDHLGPAGRVRDRGRRGHREPYERQRPEPFARALRAAKDALDPDGLLNPGVLMPVPHSEP